MLFCSVIRMIFVQPVSLNQKLLFNCRVADLAMGRKKNLTGAAMSLI